MSASTTRDVEATIRDVIEPGEADPPRRVG
jgi:hypothetical protein